jgi:ADP-ribosylglycohydrolase
MQGGDTDTNCAVVGQILGSHLGYNKLPADWINSLKHTKWLNDKIDLYLDKLGYSDNNSEN